MEDRLNALLADPNAMGRIMDLAQQLSGHGAPPPPEATPEVSAPDLGIDPQMLAKLMPLLRKLGSGGNDRTAQLLRALRPYLAKARQDKVEQAIKLAHMIHIAKSFMAEGGWDYL